MFENNRLTKLLNIKYPIIQGGMAGVSDSSLASAVSNAGGLGVIGSGFASTSWLEEEILKTKELTDKPFGVNLLMQNPNVPELLKVIIKHKVPVVFTGGGNPLPIMPYLKQAKIKVIPVVPSSRLAQKMSQNGADAVVVEGGEGGGHIGEGSTFCLVPQARKIVDIPLIAAGGIFDSATFRAAMTLGADGVQVGTRFIATTECGVHENYKKAIVNATDEDVVVVARFTGHPIRLIKNKVVETVRKMESKNPFPEELNSERFAGGKITQENVDNIPLLCGICAGAINDIKSCQEIIEDMVKDYE
ncbi:MAG TPA: nitronate monooxygenase [Candidatus Pacearchaeota archaeon]|jgi:enoyl-[acyl-carrier protein] reductase II|nr:nitronate monooxygenase [Candidatus Pacearchaeota archaeon]